MTRSLFHSGLCARWWRLTDEGGPELEHFGDLIKRQGGTALDAGCGSGRLLLPWLARGLAVEGSDNSADMLAACRERAAERGLEPTLHHQALHELDIERRYRTIVVCGAFAIGTTREQDLEGLRRLRAHLQPGGVLALDQEMPWSDEATWRRWLPEPPQDADAADGQGTRWRDLPDGSRIALRSSPAAIDPVEQLMTQTLTFELWRDGSVQRTEDRVLRFRWYLPQELRSMLQSVGFGEVRLSGDYTDAPLTRHHAFAVLTATAG